MSEKKEAVKTKKSNCPKFHENHWRTNLMASIRWNISSWLTWPSVSCHRYCILTALFRHMSKSEAPLTFWHIKVTKAYKATFFCWLIPMIYSNCEPCECFSFWVEKENKDWMWTSQRTAELLSFRDRAEEPTLGAELSIIYWWNQQEHI